MLLGGYKGTLTHAVKRWGWGWGWGELENALWGGVGGRTWTKSTPRRNEAAAYPVMSPMTPPPKATKVVRRSKRALMALS